MRGRPTAAGRWRLPLALVLSLLLAACATPRGGVRPPSGAAPRGGVGGPVTVGWEQTGHASWYGRRHQGRETASGERYDMHALTCAHRTLPLGTRLLVTNLDNGRSVEVRVNDRGPFVDGRILDLSYAAAERLGAVATGVVPVRLRVLALPSS